MKGGKKVEEETKKPCTPVEEAGRDYNELGLYLPNTGSGTDPLGIPAGVDGGQKDGCV